MPQTSKSRSRPCGWTVPTYRVVLQRAKSLVHSVSVWCPPVKSASWTPSRFQGGLKCLSMTTQDARPSRDQRGYASSIKESAKVVTLPPSAKTNRPTPSGSCGNNNKKFLFNGRPPGQMMRLGLECSPALEVHISLHLNANRPIFISVKSSHMLTVQT